MKTIFVLLIKLAVKIGRGKRRRRRKKVKYFKRDYNSLSNDTSKLAKAKQLPTPSSFFPTILLLTLQTVVFKRKKKRKEKEIFFPVSLSSWYSYTLLK